MLFWQLEFQANNKESHKKFGFHNHWKQAIVMMSNLVSLVAPKVVVMTTSGDTSDKVGIINILVLYIE